MGEIPHPLIPWLWKKRAAQSGRQMSETAFPLERANFMTGEGARPEAHKKTEPAFLFELEPESRLCLGA